MSGMTRSRYCIFETEYAYFLTSRTRGEGFGASEDMKRRGE